jgi:hypothetical protein
MYTWSRDTSVTKLSGPARDGSSTSVFAPLIYQIDNGHASQRRTENGSQNLGHVRESSSLFHEVWRRQLFLSQADVGQNWEWKWSSRDMSGPRHVTYRWVYLRHAPYMVFLLALCPFFFFAFASFPSISPDGSLPCSSHSSSIFVAAWYPNSCISSNLVHCSVPYCQIRDWQHIPSISSSTHLLHWHRHIKATTGDLGLFQSLHTRNAVRIM